MALDQSTNKTYRISLMKDVQSTDTYFERPDDFNLEDYWNNSMKTFRKKLPSYIVTIKTDKETYEHMKLRRLKIQQANNVEGVPEFVTKNKKQTIELP